MKPMSRDTNPRPRYERPRLRTIELVADEVLGTGCKLEVGTANPYNPISCTQTPCVAKGS
jgi:hypothetical protein